MSIVDDGAKQFMEENKELMEALASQEEMDKLRSQVQTLTQDVSHWKHEAKLWKDACLEAHRELGASQLDKAKTALKEIMDLYLERPPGWPAARAAMFFADQILATAGQGDAR